MEPDLKTCADRIQTEESCRDRHAWPGDCQAGSKDSFCLAEAVQADLGTSGDRCGKNCTFLRNDSGWWACALYILPGLIGGIIDSPGWGGEGGEGRCDAYMP